MNKHKFFKRIISAVLAITMSVSAAVYSSFSVSALSEEDMTDDGMALGFSILNGYTKLSLKNTDPSMVQPTAVYCGLDVFKPYTLLCAGWFYIRNNVDLERASTDNDYTVDLLTRLDEYLSKKGITNEKAEMFKNSYFDSEDEIITSLDSVGLYIFEASNSASLELIENEYVDFVLAGGRVPENMKDLNLDGKTDYVDSELIQKYVCGLLEYDDSDEDAYILYASDYNSDREINIADVTDLRLALSSG
ncbi:MAG: hypothetical protein LUF33_01390 [Clostridiales bacterium]|nr:hypothetical protein [Clostridiales bacterium]